MKTLRSLTWPLIGSLLVLAVWALAARTMSPVVLPSPVDVADALVGLLGESSTWSALGQSLSSYIIGLGIAAALGTVIGLTAGLDTRVRGLTAPVTGLLNSVPAVAWMGLSMIWFGLGAGPTVFLIVVTTTPILITALIHAVADRDRRYGRLADVYELSPGTRLRHVLLPPLAGSARAALVSMAGLGWKLTVMGEFMTASEGLGGILVDAKSTVQTDRVIAVTVLLVAVWGAVAALLHLVEHRPPTPLRFTWARPTGRAPEPPAVPAATTQRPQRRDTPLIRCTGVALGHDTVAVADLSFSVRPGQVTAVLGPSGIGKSSLLDLLAGLLTPVNGTVDRADDLKVSAVFQDDLLLPWRTVEQNITLFSGADPATVRHRLAAMGLTDTAGRPPGDLSGGMRRRAALARGILRDADLLLLDEPFAGLDPRRRAGCIRDIDRLREDRGQAVVVVTHDVDDALLLADEAVVLGGGPPARVIEQVDLSFLARPRDLTSPDAAAVRARLLTALLTPVPSGPFLTPVSDPLSRRTDL